MHCSQIIEEYLKEKGFDGLHHNDDCGCKLGDLYPCENNFSDCEPGHLKPGDDEYDFYIG